MFEYEKKLWDSGVKTIAGADEVGRGAFAGPVMVGCVSIRSLDSCLRRQVARDDRIVIRDSKKMSHKQRVESSIWIKENLLWSVGKASVAEINKFGIVGATNKAYRRAIQKLNLELEHLLVDAFYIPKLKNLPREKQTAIIKGDSLSFLIAAASIVAKVERDALMTKLAQKKDYQKYFWHKNKGYGTVEHRNAIKEFGITRLHRELWVSKFY